MNQRIYNQSAVVPYRFNDGTLEILLITNQSGRKWIVPKGLVEPGMTAQESAEMEAWEEAGVSGEVHPDVIGTYKYRKWGRVCVVDVYLMRVTKEDDDWQEAHFRERRWVIADKAAGEVKDRGLRAILEGVSGEVGKVSEG